MVCDEPIESLVAKYGDYPKLLSKFLSQASQSEGMEEGELEWDCFKIFQGESLPDPQPYSAIFISGSHFSVNDPLDWIEGAMAWIRRHWKEGSCKASLVGICFGHQLIARAFGATVGGTSSWEMGWTPIQLSETGVRLFGRPAISINSIHKEEVKNLPEGFAVLGESAGCENQGMMLLKRDKMGGILTLQGHPELSSDYVTDLAKHRYQQGTIPEEVYKRVLATNGNHIDHDHIGRISYRFISNRQ